MIKILIIVYGIILFSFDSPSFEKNIEQSTTYISDSLSNERDIVVYTKKDNDSATIFRKVLIPLTEQETSYSIRNGRELLIAEVSGRLNHVFNEIDGYSSLFIDSTSFRIIDDINDSQYYYLLLTIQPHESLGQTWIYYFDSKFQLLKTLRSDEVEIKDSKIQIKNFALSDEWGPSVDDQILSYLYKDTEFPLHNFQTVYEIHLDNGNISRIETKYPDSEFLTQVHYAMFLMKEDSSQCFSEEAIETLQAKIMELMKKE